MRKHNPMLAGPVPPQLSYIVDANVDAAAKIEFDRRPSPAVTDDSYQHSNSQSRDVSDIRARSCL